MERLLFKLIETYYDKKDLTNSKKKAPSTSEKINHMIVNLKNTAKVVVHANKMNSAKTIELKDYIT